MEFVVHQSVFDNQGFSSALSLRHLFDGSATTWLPVELH